MRKENAFEKKEWVGNDLFIFYNGAAGGLLR